MTCLDCELKQYSFHPRKDARQLELSFEYNFGLDAARLLPELQSLFHTNAIDAGAKAFLRRCSQQSTSCPRLLVDSVGGMLLRPFVSRTTFNGLLFRGGMHVLSTEQCAFHLKRRVGEPGRLLDIGAGDGGVTACLAPLFSEVSVTESNAAMRWRLARRGYRVLTPEELDTKCATETFDTIACFNVLDRCDSPRQLLRRMRVQLVPLTGLLILAVVFPFRPFVEQGTRHLPPRELIVVEGENLEENINSFVADTLQPLGFVVETISRAPYLCEGDSRKPYYLLHDIIFVLRPLQ